MIELFPLNNMQPYNVVPCPCSLELNVIPFPCLFNNSHETLMDSHRCDAENGYLIGHGRKVRDGFVIRKNGAFL